MLSVRKKIGGIGNLMFKEAFILTLLADGAIPDQYLQSYRFWGEHVDMIRSHFSEGIGDTIPKVSLHIRRGDYLNTDFYVDLTKTDYYQKAVAEFPDSTFLVFCKDNQGWEQDKKDRQWCRDFLDTFIKGRYELVDKDNTEEQDMNLMASCEGHIGANSSFSWWAAFLGGGKTIMPKEWFADGQKRIDLFPEWKVI